MNAVAAHILKEQYIKKIPDLTEEQFSKYARNLVMRKGVEGPLLTKSIRSWVAKLVGKGGLGGQILPIGVEIEGKAAKEINADGQKPIIIDRDYPGATLEQAANAFQAQAILLYRAEKRGSTIGPDLSALIEPRPITSINAEREGSNEEFVNRQQKMREAYANSVFPSIDALIPNTKKVIFDSSRGRHETLAPAMSIGLNNHTTGLCFETVKANEATELVCLRAIGLTSKKAIDGSLRLSKRIEKEMKVLTLVCSWGSTAAIFIGGGPLGLVSRNDAYDFLGSIGKPSGSQAVNSKVPYRDIDLPLYELKISKESFTTRSNDVMLLPLSLDIAPARAKTASNRPFEGSHDLAPSSMQSGRVLLPVYDAESFDTDYDDHPQVVQYRKGTYIPGVIDFLSSVNLAKDTKYQPAEMNPMKTKWIEMRKETSAVKEGTVDDLINALEVFSIPFGYECILSYNRGECYLAVNGENAITNIQQTREFAAYCESMGIKEIIAKGVLTPRDNQDFELVDYIVDMDEIPTNEEDSIAIFSKLEVRVYGALDGKDFNLLRPLALSTVKSCRSQSAKFVELSNRNSDLYYSEMISDELESGYANKLLMTFENASPLHLYGDMQVDATIIAFDIEGKNPQNNLVGNVALALISKESVKIDGKSKTVEAFVPIGTTNAFRGFTTEAKRRMLDYLMDHALQPGYKDGYLLIDPVKAQLTLNVSFKGFAKQESQPIYEHYTEMRKFKGDSLPKPAFYEKGIGRVEPTELKYERIKIPTFTDAVPVRTYLREVGKKKLPMLKNPVITSLGTTIDGLDDMFEKSKVRYSVKESFSLQVPLSQLKKNGPEPPTKELDLPGSMSVSDLLNLSLNPPSTCPMATQNLEVNTKNRDAAVKAPHIQYGPLNLSDEDYWVRYGERWNTDAQVAKNSNCSNCIAFDISPRMKDCMPGKTSDKEGQLGYCWMHHFKCHSARTCYTWASGGPIDLDSVSLDWQKRSESAFKSNPPTDNWTAHRQKVPWEFDQDAFDGTAFRTFQMDDPEDRRKAIHMDGWRRRFDKYKGVQAIAGKLSSTGKWHIQSIRVPKKYNLRRNRKEMKLDKQQPPQWYVELRPNTKPFGTKNNPIIPHDYIKAMDRGWTGYPHWMIKRNPAPDVLDNAYYHGTTLSKAREIFASRWFNFKEDYPTFTDSLDVAIRFGVVKWLGNKNPADPIVILQLDSEAADKTLKRLERIPDYFSVDGHYYAVMDPIPSYFLRPVQYTEEQFHEDYEKMKMKHKHSHAWGQKRFPVPSSDQYASLNANWDGNYISSWLDDPYNNWWNFREQKEHAPFYADKKNPMAPGYQSYGWTTQDWRSIKVNNKGEIDYSQKCGAEGTQTASGKPRLCLPAPVVKALMRTDSGKQVIREQARKKVRAKKGERIPWHPRIKKLWKKLEEKTPADKRNPVLPKKKHGNFPPAVFQFDPGVTEGAEWYTDEEGLHEELSSLRKNHDEYVKQYMRKNFSQRWSWETEYTGKRREEEKKILEKAKTVADKHFHDKMCTKGEDGKPCEFWHGGMKAPSVGEPMAWHERERKPTPCTVGSYKLCISGCLFCYKEQGSTISNPPGIPKKGSELTTEKKREIRKRWLELVNMTKHELQTFYDSEWGNKRAGLSRDEAKEAGISSGRDSALAILKMKETPVKEWSKRKSKDRGRDIMLDFWQWAQKQINFNTRHRGMQGAYLDDRGRPKRKLLGLWIWGHDPWRYALQVTGEKMGECPNVAWVGRKEKEKYGVRPMINPPTIPSTAFKLIPSAKPELTYAEGYAPQRIVERGWWMYDAPCGEYSPPGWLNINLAYDPKGEFNAGQFCSNISPDWIIWDNPPKFTPLYGDILTISGPSGSGKSTMAQALAKKLKGQIIPSYMTREKRPKEKEGIDGVFITKDKFEEMIENGEFTAGEVNLWVKQKNGEYYGRRASDFAISKPVIIDANFEGIRRMRAAFPNKTYSVFIRTGMGEDRRKQLLTARGVHTEEEIESRVKAGTGMLSTFQNMNFDFIAANKRGELPKNVKMIASEFKKWRNRPMANPPAHHDKTSIVRRFVKDLDPSIEFTAKSLEGRLKNAGYRMHPNARQIGRILSIMKKEGLIVQTKFSGSVTYRNSESNYAMENPPSVSPEDYVQFYRNIPVFEGDGALDMGIQTDKGKTKYHNQWLDGVFSDMPDKAEAWKKQSFSKEIALRTVIDEDGTVHEGFLDKYADDNRPYTVSLKVDGDSSLIHFNGNESVVWNKRGRWRRNFHITDEMTDYLQSQGIDSAQILGELYAVDEGGATLSLKEISSIIVAPKTMERQKQIRFAAFDILELNGRDYIDTPYGERMEALDNLFAGEDLPSIMSVPMLKSDGGVKEVLELWEESMSEPNFEGLVLRFDGDNKSIKIKMKGTADLAIIGYYHGKEGGNKESIVGGGALAWMLPNGDFIYAGKSVIGSTDKEKGELLELLSKDQIDAPNMKLGGRVVSNSVRETHDVRGKGMLKMVKPKYVGEFLYRNINFKDCPVFRLKGKKLLYVGTVRAPVLQQPSFKKWREDKSINAQDLRIEQVPLEGTGKWGQIKPNPPGDLPEDIEYPGGHGQYLTDSITIGALIEQIGADGKKRRNLNSRGFYQEHVNPKWPLEHPELAARLIEAEKKGWKIPQELAKHLIRPNPPKNTGVMLPPIIVTGTMYDSKLLRQYPNYGFIFGDNEKRTGKGGQAVIRDEPNAIGVRTKASSRKFWNDSHMQNSVKMMSEDFLRVFNGGYDAIVIPVAGIGTGLAELKKRAPLTNRWLQTVMEQLNTIAKTEKTGELK